MNAEQQLAVSLLQDHPAQTDLARLNTLGDAGWRQLISVTDGMGLTPLLSGRIHSHRLKVPATIDRQLLERLRSNTGHNLRILAEFGVLAIALRREDVACMPLKGVYLCSNVYDNPGERRIWDIDLMVAPEDLPRALPAIEGTGYRASRTFDLDLEIKSHQHVPVYIKAGAPPLEVHWTLLGPRFGNGFRWRDLWDRSVPAQVGDVTAQVLSPVDLVIYLCAHAAYHHVYATSVRLLYDIKLVVGKFSAELDWVLLARRARDLGLINSAYLSLRLTKELLGCGLADAALEALRPSDFGPQLIPAAYARLFDQMSTSPVINAVWARSGLWRRFKGLWDRIALRPSALARTYHLPPYSWRIWIYYLVRLRDMLGIYGVDLFGLILGRRRKKELARRDAQLLAYLRWWE